MGEARATSELEGRRRFRSDKGAVLVEFALVLPILVMLLLGMVTAGMAYNKKLAITNGVREGSRYGATLAVSLSSCSSGPTSGTVNCWLTQVANVAQSSSEGELSSSAPALNICVAYVNDTGVGSDATTKLTRTASGDTFSTGTCYSDGLSSQRRVQVTGSRQGEIQFLVTTMTPTLSSQAVTRFEAAQ